MHFASIMPPFFILKMFFPMISYLSHMLKFRLQCIRAYTLGKKNLILSLHIFSQHNLVKPQKPLIFFWSCNLCESSF